MLNIIILLLLAFLIHNYVIEPFRADREYRVTPPVNVLAYGHKYGRHILERNELTKDEQTRKIMHQMRRDQLASRNF